MEILTKPKLETHSSTRRIGNTSRFVLEIRQYLSKLNIYNTA